MWNQECAKYKNKKGTTETRIFDETAFNDYLAWFHTVTRLEVCPRAYADDTLDEDLVYEDVAQFQYTKLVRDGRRTQFAPLINYVVRSRCSSY
jgi:hypothetical protein